MSNFDARILDILAEHPSSGSYTETAIDNGSEVTHCFSLAIGLRWLQARGQYTTRFGDTPEWVLTKHPYHRGSLCELALKYDRALPEDCPPVGAEPAKTPKHRFDPKVVEYNRKKGEGRNHKEWSERLVKEAVEHLAKKTKEQVMTAVSKGKQEFPHASIILGGSHKPNSNTTSGSYLPAPPQRKDFKTQMEFEEAMGFWQSRVGRIKGMKGVKRITDPSEES